MATITEDYVSFEIAKLLKEKGFPQNPNICNTAYTFRGKLSNNAKSFAHNFTEFNELGIKPITYSIAPTLQMAMKWLREVHNIDVSVVPLRSHKEYLPRVEADITSHDAIPCRKYEEACEVAIKYCLENLI